MNAADETPEAAAKRFNVTVEEELHTEVKVVAAQKRIKAKDLVSLCLGYALPRVKSGELKVQEEA